MKRFDQIIIFSIFLSCYLNAKAIQRYYLNTTSPDKRWIAFVYREKITAPEDCKYDVHGDDVSRVDQLWIYDTKKNKKHLLANYNFLCDLPEKVILHINAIAFSPDSKTIYFETDAWLHSDAIHAVNIDGSGEHYLTFGDSVEIIQKSDGDTKGDLVIDQRRYFLAGGSYDWYWLYTPSGKEEGPIGEDFGDEQRKMIEEE